MEEGGHTLSAHVEGMNQEEPGTTSPSSSPKSEQEQLFDLLRRRFEASMVLGGVGDAMGYRGGSWEFNHSGESIHKELHSITKGRGISALHLHGWDWRVSDDTVMQIATAEALITELKGDALYQKIGERYVACWEDMGGRAPGGTCSGGVHRMKSNGEGWNTRQFAAYGGGCGAAMRAMCIGLRYPHPDQLEDLIATAVESGRITHNHPTGYLGAVAAALFTAYSIQRVPQKLWGCLLIGEVLPKVCKYIERIGREVPQNLGAMDYFQEKWKQYLKVRRIEAPNDEGPVYPEAWGPSERDAFYKPYSFTGWPGASGHDAPLVAYDSLLFSGSSWENVCLTSMLNGGDSDSIGTIAGACYGAWFGFDGVPSCNYKDMEYCGRLKKLGRDLFDRFVADVGAEAVVKQFGYLLTDQSDPMVDVKILAPIELSESDPRVVLAKLAMDVLFSKRSVTKFLSYCTDKIVYVTPQKFNIIKRADKVQDFFDEFLRLYTDIHVQYTGPFTADPLDENRVTFPFTMTAEFLDESGMGKPEKKKVQLVGHETLVFVGPEDEEEEEEEKEKEEEEEGGTQLKIARKETTLGAVDDEEYKESASNFMVTLWEFIAKHQTYI